MEDDGSADRRALVATVTVWSAQVSADARALLRRRWCRRHVPNDTPRRRNAASAGRSEYGRR